MGKKNIKIILSGLDNAGKSSMLVGLRKMYGFEDEVQKLKPTIRVDYYRRDFLNLQLNFFDMGGQEKFRKSYLRRPIYFEEVNQLIYLVDIQDEVRFEESMEYLGKILDILEEVGYDKNKPIYICFSKADYDFVSENLADYISRVKMIKDLIQKTYESFTFDYYSTSIFNIYTIVKMISSGLRRYLDTYDSIHRAIEGFGEKNKVKQLLLFDHTGLVISDYFKGEGEGLELQNQIDKIISSHLGFFSQLEDHNLEVTSTRGVDGDFMNLCFQFHLFKELQDDIEDISYVDQERSKKNPKYYNYYLSMVSKLDSSVDIEAKIPGLIDKVKTSMNQMLIEDE